MCGIIGGKGEGAFEYVKNNIHLLNKRGPDHQEVKIFDSNLVLGATRLAMTDPHKRSNQPMTDNESGNVILFNGEVYNYKMLRDELRKLGIKFETESDTEVLLKALTTYGKEVIYKFEGMFAFVFFDKTNNEIILSRDYLGKKPLYYFLNIKQLFFSSMASIVQNYIGKSGINPQALSEYLKLGYVIDPITFYQDVTAVKPGEIITLDLRSLTVKSITNFISSAIKNADSVDIRHGLQNALIKRTEGHSKFALSLSGGIDSNILAIECAKMNLPVEAYTMKWSYSDKDRYNIDASIAKINSKLLGIKFNEVEMPSATEIPNLLSDFVKAMDEPNANSTGVSMMVLYSKIAEDGHRLTITGDGADELYGGYQRYDVLKMLNRLPQFNSIFLNRLLDMNLNNKILNNFAYSFIGSDKNNFWEKWHFNTNNRYLKELVPDLKHHKLNLFGSELSGIFYNNRVSNMMFRDLRTWISMESNRKLDRVSMWHSIEARSPFQSETVIDNAYNNMGKSQFQKSSKEILLESYPELDLLTKQPNKQGFISPVGYWLRNNPELVMYSIENLIEKLPFNQTEMRKISKGALEKNFDKIKILWSLVVLNCWIVNKELN